AVSDKDAHALKVRSIGVKSGYRSPETDKTAWEQTFRTEMKSTQEKRAAMNGGELGEEALKFMVSEMTKYKAIPGFSNHTTGIAMDFGTNEKGLGDLGPSKSQKGLWRKSWFYQWLTTNGASFGFK